MGAPVSPALLRRLEQEILRRRDGSVLRVAIDGVDGAGKTTLADALASVEVIDAAYDAMWRATWVPIASDLSQSLAVA